MSECSTKVCVMDDSILYLYPHKQQQITQYNNNPYHQIMSKQDRSQQLLKEIKKGNISEAKKILSDPTININMVDKKTGKNLLQLSIESEEPDLFDEILSKPNINLNLSNLQNTETVLQTAVLFDNLEAINKLISKGVDITRVNSRNQNAIDVAVIENKSAVLQLFWKYDDELIIKNSAKLFREGFENSSIEACLFLIKSLPVKSLTKLDEDGNNVIHLAVEGNMTSLVKELLGRIAANEELTDVEKEFAWNSQNKKGDTYLHIAYRNEFQTIITLIENPDYNVFLNRDIRNQKGETVKDVVRKIELSKESEIKRQEKMREQKKQRDIEKEEMKRREIELGERRKIEEKEAAERQEVEQRKSKEEEKKKTRYFALLILALVLILTYYGLDYAASNSKKGGML